MLEEQPPTPPSQMPADKDVDLGSAESRPPRNDHVSPIAIIVLLAFWVLQSSFLGVLTNRFQRHTLTHPDANADGTVPNDVDQGLIGVDIEAKTAYVFADGRPGSVQAQLQPSMAKGRQIALKMAQDLLNKNPDQPSLARRVILLRAEMGNSTPLSALPVRRGHAAHYPLDAFNPSQGMTPGIGGQLADERQTWQTLFGSPGPITAQQESTIAAHINRTPNLRWWREIALHQLYVRAGDGGAAVHALGAAARTARSSVAVYILLIGLMFVLGLVGIVCLIFLILRWTSSADNAPVGEVNGPPVHQFPAGAEPPPTIFDATAPLVSDADRRLGAGDLINVFIFYLVLMMAVGILAGPGLDAVVGRHRLDRLPQSDLVTIIVIAQAAVTAFCGGLTVVVLAWLARRRGADISREIGLNLGGKPLWRTMLFGLLGWAIALPLVLVVASVTQVVFHSAPAPANPAIPLIISAHTGIAAIVMYILVAVIAPFVEETMFRGLFFNAARLRFGPAWGIALTGITFGLAHPVGIAEQFTLATLGAVLAWMAQTKKSLLPGMIAHGLQNSVAFALFLISLASIPGGR